ncbi:unnamed protein product [Angiostrongylus costaricensis]|uniref:CUB domain-containing protein n=1 Tax=Angiostrongylus costaricensis TaxID=334426 RepID=A0A0R3Q035_ANGCS|nr:unnamed protein product [Angiostrongylus costaricensis]
MKLVLVFVLFALSINVESNPLSSNERRSSGKTFDEKLEEGYQLKCQPNANVTRRLTEHLGNMEGKIMKRLTLSSEKNTEQVLTTKDYVEVENDGRIHQMGDANEEINEDSKVSASLFQGDILLTKEQAKVILEDTKYVEAERTKRQAYTEDKIGVFNGVGCFSSLGRIGGEQRLSFQELRCESPKGCGRILNATVTFQTLTDTLGEKDVYFPKEDFEFCNYWIMAPAGSRIEVVLESFEKGLATDGCVFAGVEIKTGSDKRHTGYRFCSLKFAKRSLISKHNVVPVITYTRTGEVTTVLHYRISSV